jgi:hypothetical protein
LFVTSKNKSAHSLSHADNQLNLLRALRFCLHLKRCLIAGEKIISLIGIVVVVEMGSSTALNGVTFFVAVIQCMDRMLLVHLRHVKGKAGQEVEASGSSRQSAYEGSKFVSPMHRPPLPAGNIPGNHFC